MKIESMAGLEIPPMDTLCELLFKILFLKEREDDWAWRLQAAATALKDLVAISNGSACTSSSYTPSHVIKAMGYGDDEANEAIRMSWCHLTPEVEWDELVERVRGLR